MGFRPPTPASCPIVLDRKEPGRELEPLRGPDHHGSRCRPARAEGVGSCSQRLTMAPHRPWLEVMGGWISDTLVLQSLG